MVNRPSWEIEVGTEMTPIKGLSVNADFYTGLGYKAMNPTTAEVIHLPNHFDLNLGAAYTFHEQCTVFAQFNNIINSKYQYYYGYENIGFNCLFGIKITF
jgi:outer membrane cobalamin receptor